MIMLNLMDHYQVNCLWHGSNLKVCSVGCRNNPHKFNSLAMYYKSLGGKCYEIKGGKVLIYCYYSSYL